MIEAATIRDDSSSKLCKSYEYAEEEKYELVVRDIIPKAIKDPIKSGVRTSEEKFEELIEYLKNKIPILKKIL